MKGVIILCPLFFISLSSSFLVTPSFFRPSQPALSAKKAGRTTKRKSGGGFGATVEKRRVDNDYAVFPALEPHILDTIVGSSDSLSSQELPEEIYQRLDQIYGFPTFNYVTDHRIAESIQKATMSQTTSSTNSILDNLSTEHALIDDLLQKDKTSTDTLNLHKIPSFTKFRVLHVDPLVLAVDEFFTPQECDNYIAMAENKEQTLMSRSPTVGKDAAAKSQRTSTTWYHHYANVPELMAKASRVLGIDDITRWEEPQTVRYRRTEQFTWHLDALGPNENKPKLGGQRIVTLLVYLTELQEGEGGSTVFRDLGGVERLRVRPRRGTALLFFPAAGGIDHTPLDIRTLHCGEAVASDSSQDKWISQIWLRESQYQPTAPPGNQHAAATQAILNYCDSF